MNETDSFSKKIITHPKSMIILIRACHNFNFGYRINQP